MKVVLQRVKYASVKVDDKICGKIEKGFLALVGFTHDDSKNIIEKMAKKCVELRVFEDDAQKMNLSLKDINGKILSVSQFTLYADTRKGRRPGFEYAMKPDLALQAYKQFNDCLKSHGIEVECGIFGADMKVELLNDGPVTIILDSKEW